MRQQAVTIDLEKRLSTVEVQISSLANTVERYIDSASKHDEVIVGKLETISNRMASAGKPNWSIIVAVFGVAMVIVGYYVSGLVNPLQIRVETHDHNILTLQSDYKDLAKSDLQIIGNEAEHTKSIAVLEAKWELWEKGLLKNPSESMGQK